MLSEFTYQSWGLIRSGDQWSFDLYQLNTRPCGSLNAPCGYFSVPECVTGMDILRNWQSSHIGSLICGRKSQFRSPELFPSIKIVNQKVIPYS